MTPPPDVFAAARSVLRQAARQRRAALSSTERITAALAARDQLLALPALRQARNIAAYATYGDELDLGPTVSALQALGRTVLLPRLLRLGRRMEFRAHRPDVPLIQNRHGIGEPPADAPRVAPRFLHIVLLPLAAFDLNGGRLGTGSGYYDRCFAFRRDRAHWQMPRLIGVGHDCQEVAEIPAGAWDVPLDLVVTGTRLIHCAPGPA